MNKRIPINGKTAFYLSLIAIGIIIVTVWITRYDVKRTVSENALYSLSIITLLFFTFITLGLYIGIRIKDNFGKIKDKIGFVGPTDLPMDATIIGAGAEGGLEGIVLGILAWIAITILIILFMIFFETILLAVLVITSAVLYWIFYRATKLIFRYSPICKGNLTKSMWIGLKYGLLYSSWIYGMIFILELIKKNW